MRNPFQSGYCQGTERSIGNDFGASGSLGKGLIDTPWKHFLVNWSKESAQCLWDRRSRVSVAHIVESFGLAVYSPQLAMDS
ncbi:hypothetical protein R1flu_020231 [Riccia fluitans]|uniref:Uncharacterized protein n=1 Tax=Riccia fluitans TaxID=41844 RepID=A0ABD1ZKY5_9MARC